MKTEIGISAMEKTDSFGDVIHSSDQMNTLAVGVGSCCCSCSCSAAVFTAEEITG